MRLKGSLLLGLLDGRACRVNGLAMIAAGDIATIASAVLTTMVSASMTLGRKRPDAEAEADEGAADLLLATELSLDQIAARPGNVLVPLRNPRCPTSWRRSAAGDRDVVVMTAKRSTWTCRRNGRAEHRPRTSAGCCRTSSCSPSASGAGPPHDPMPRAM
jgi:hypothetical protein